MEKIFSVLLAVAVLASSLPVFASSAVVEGGYATNVYYDDMSAYSNGIDSNVINTNSGDNEVSYSYNDGQIEFSKKGSADANYIYYNFNKTKYTADFMSFGFDLTVSGATGVSDGTSAIVNVNPGANNPGGSSWVFRGENANNLAIYLSEEKDDNGVAKLKIGDKILEQGKKYTYTYYVNFKNHTYDITVAGEDGVAQKVFSDQKLGSEFSNLYKFEIGIRDQGAKAYLDNVFVKYNDTASLAIINSDKLQVADNGTISLNAIIPLGYTDPKLYINDTFVENINLTDGKADYVITAALPAGTAFGDAEIKLTAKDGEADKSIVFNAELVKEIKTLKESIITNGDNYGFNGVTNFGNVSAETIDGNTVLKIKSTLGENSKKLYSEFTTGDFKETYSGVYEMSFDIKTSNPSGVSLHNERFTYKKTENGSTITDGVNFDLNGSSVGAHHAITKETGRIGDIPIIANEWNKVATRVDYKNATYAIYLNGEVALSGKLTNADTYPSFKAYRITIGSGLGEGEEVYFKNLELHQISSYPEIGDISLYYGGGSSEKYNGTTATSVGLTKIEFNTSDEVTLGANGAKLKNASGEDTGATVTASGKVITADLPSGVLPTGKYTLCIASDASVSGAALGAEVRKEISLVSGDSIISPASSVIEDTSAKLSVYAENAEKVIFAVDGEIVEEFDVPSNSMYTYTFASPSIGEKTFDAYIIKDGETKLLSKKFALEPYCVANEKILNEWSSIKVNGTDTAVTDGKMVHNSNIWSQGGLSSVAMAGRAVVEGDFTPATNTDNYYFVYAYNKNDEYKTDDNFLTLDDMIGYKDASSENYALFNADGTIYNTGIEYKANQKYHIKMVLDTDANAYEFYVDGELIAKKQCTENDAIGKANFMYNRIRLYVSNAAGTKYTANTDSTACAYFTNAKLYQEYKAPKLDDVYSGETDLTNKPVPEGTTELRIALDKAYTVSVADSVKVKLDGEVADGVDVSYSDADKSYTLSGLNLKGVKKLELEIPKTNEISIPYADTTNKTYTTKTVEVGNALSISLDVVDSDGLNVAYFTKTAAAGKNLAIVKFKNYSGSDINGYVFAADSATHSAVSATPVTFAPNTSDAVAAEYTGASKLFVWNSNLKPLIDAVELQ